MLLQIPYALKLRGLKLQAYDRGEKYAIGWYGMDEQKEEDWIKILLPLSTTKRPTTKGLN